MADLLIRGATVVDPEALTLVRGTIVMDKGEVVDAPGFGRYLRR